MSLGFLVPTLICVAAVYLASRWQDEPSLILNGVAILSFLVALVLAPWEVQVLLLLSVWWVARYGLRSPEPVEMLESEVLGDRAELASSSVAADEAELTAVNTAAPAANDSILGHPHLAVTDRVYRGVIWHMPDRGGLKMPKKRQEVTSETPEATEATEVEEANQTIELKYRGATFRRKV
ncbi:hypothetical protein [Limnothrix redekei]|uniref:Uncharacterized protein n=1 Tax=Limnothrix redekei LRLZ20PSL1 TaxID=3112953 RepID=A0ABW7CG09_9CYAN